MRTISLLLAALAVSYSLAKAGVLHQAARECDETRMRQLLSERPVLNERDEAGLTPLHVAIDSRQVVCVGLLVEAGADRLARDGKGRTPFGAAGEITEQRIQGAVHRLLLGNPLVEASSEEPAGPMPWSLEYSVLHRQTELTKMLLQLGADPNAPGKRGSRPLADAALKGDAEGARLLLNAGARIDAVSQSGTQPIHDAALGDSVEVIQELASRGADINARAREGAQTPLHFAASMGRIKAVEALVALGADPAAQDANGRTPLDVAERAEFADVAAFLKHAASDE